MAKKKPGKYDHLLAILPPLPPGDPEYQMKVETEKERFRQCQHCNGTGTITAIIEDEHPEETVTKACGRCDGTGRRKLDAQTLAAEYVMARADVATVEAAAFRANLALEAVSQLLIANNDTKKDPAWGAFGASEHALKMTNGDNIRLQGAPFPQANDKGQFREWCYNHGLRGAMELPAKPTLDLVKLRLLNGEPMPDGVKAYVRTTIVYTPLKTEVAAADDAQPTSEDDVF